MHLQLSVTSRFPKSTRRTKRQLIDQQPLDAASGRCGWLKTTGSGVSRPKVQPAARLVTAIQRASKLRPARPARAALCRLVSRRPTSPRKQQAAPGAWPTAAYRSVFSFCFRLSTPGPPGVGVERTRGERAGADAVIGKSFEGILQSLRKTMAGPRRLEPADGSGFDANSPGAPRAS